MATTLEWRKTMTRGKLITGAAVMAAALELGSTPSRAQEPRPTFKSSVEMVRIAAVVRDHKGRFVQDLTVRDFEVMESGQARKIADFRQDVAGVSVAVLFDVSGSMQGHLPTAREAAMHLLSWLDPVRDEAGVFTFDTHLDAVAPFAVGLKTLPEAMTSVVPFGQTSLHDAIALTARRAAERDGRRHAV